MTRRAQRARWLAVPITLLALASAGFTARRAAPAAATGVAPFDSVVHENDANEDLGAHFVGQLPHPLTDYAGHGADFHALVSGKPWHGHIRLRQCTGCPTGTSARMKIEAMSNVHHDALTGLPANGVVIGRVINIGRYTDRATGIAPGPRFGRAPELYYVIKDRGDPEHADLYVVTVTFDRMRRARDQLQIQLAPVLYSKCPNHTEPPRVTSEGDFRRCPRAGMVPAAPGMPPRIRPTAWVHDAAAARQNAGDALAWFSCDAGCCTAQFPPRSDSTISYGVPTASTSASPSAPALIPLVTLSKGVP